MLTFFSSENLVLLLNRMLTDQFSSTYALERNNIWGKLWDLRLAFTFFHNSIGLDFSKSCRDVSVEGLI